MHDQKRRTVPVGAELDRWVSVKRRVRLIALLQSAEEADLAPLEIRRLHVIAYLANVLSPVWEMAPLDGSVLKRRGGPFYPALQRDLDSLVGMGVVSISGLGYARDEGERWRLEGSYRLNHAFARPILDELGNYPDELAVLEFIQELAYAVSALTDDELGQAPSRDATYADPVVSDGNVLDFGEWQRRNYSADAAQYFRNVIPGGGSATRGELLHLYARHLRRLLSAGA